MLVLLLLEYSAFKATIRNLELKELINNLEYNYNTYLCVLSL